MADPPTTPPLSETLSLRREAALLAPYAMHSADSAGRVRPEPPHPYRGPYQRDRDRIVHASAFRRLAHKTQVFTGSMGDYHRSRLTHTLEVASIARTVGRTLALNEDLVEALALLHDIGHPPFGHAGEDVLDECLADDGGFNHNAQALRIVELLERRYPEFPGLNLSQEVLDGQRTRAGKKGESKTRDGAVTLPLPPARTTALRSGDFGSPVLGLSRPHQGEGNGGHPLLEVQVVDAADSIAYNAHDADDAVELALLDVAELDAAVLWRDAAARVRSRYAALDPSQFRRATVHELLDFAVGDLVRASTARIAEAAPQSAGEARQAGRRLVAPSPEIVEQKTELERLLFERVYRRPVLLAQRETAGAALRQMFDRLVRNPAELPPKFAASALRDGLPRAAADYLAGMTDRFALDEHARLLGKPGPP